MEISKGVEIVDLALFLKKDKILILGDLHIGQEESMNKEGMLIPRFQHKDLIAKTKKILDATKPSLIILNGDVKHEFSGISRDEWKKVMEYLDLLFKYSEVIIIKGNHDNILEPIATKKGLIIRDYYVHDKIFVCHGDKLFDERQPVSQSKNKHEKTRLSHYRSEPLLNSRLGKTSKDNRELTLPEKSQASKEFEQSKTIIIGHEHPSIGLTERNRVEKYKCFLKGKYKDKTLIVMPSMNQMTEGTDVLTERLLSPYLHKTKDNPKMNIDKFETWIVEQNEVFHFGLLKGLKRK